MTARRAERATAQSALPAAFAAGALALDFAAAPETYPVFRAWLAAQERADGGGAAIAAALTPAHLRELRGWLASCAGAGVVVR